MPGIAAGPRGCGNGLFAALFGAGRDVRVLLAMQKVEGSNPFSRYWKGLHLQGLFRARSRLVRLLHSGPKPDPREIDMYVRLEECGRLQGSWLVDC
jgi:hypothetical protein